MGLRISNEYTVESYTTHFIDRVIGQTSTPHDGMRQGVPISSIKKCLLNPQNVSNTYERKMSDGTTDIRKVYSNQKISCVFSTRDCRLIQVNRR